jgi:hypothetical protein
MPAFARHLLIWRLALAVFVGALCGLPMGANAHSDPEGDVYPQVVVEPSGFSVWYANNRLQREAWKSNADAKVPGALFRAYFSLGGRLLGQPERLHEDEKAPTSQAEHELESLSYTRSLEGLFAFDSRSWLFLNGDDRTASTPSQEIPKLFRLESARSKSIPLDLAQHSFTGIKLFAASKQLIVLGGQSCDFAGSNIRTSESMQKGSSLEGECSSGTSARLAIAGVDVANGKLLTFRVMGNPIAIWGMFPVAAQPIIESEMAYVFWVEDTDDKSTLSHPSARSMLTVLDARNGRACDAVLEENLLGNSVADMKIDQGRFLAAYHDMGRIHVATGSLPRVAGNGKCTMPHLAVQRIPEMISSTSTSH